MGIEASRRGGVALSFTLGETELRPRPPLRIAILADFGASGDRVVSVSRAQDLDEIMEAMAPEVDVWLDPSPIGSAPPLSVHLSPRALLDLSPAGLVAQAPALTALYLFRVRLGLLADGKLSSEELESELPAYAAFPELKAPLEAWAKTAAGGAPAPTPSARTASGRPGGQPSADAAAIDRILDMVAPGTAAAAPQSPAPATGIGQVISGIAKPRRSLSAAIEPAVAAAESALRAGLTGLLHHPDVQALESVWRGLAFLRRRSGQDCELVLINTSSDGLVEAFEQRVRRPALAGSEAGHPALVLVHHPIRPTGVDLTRLERLAQGAEALQVPVVVRLADDFFGAGEDPVEAIGIRLDTPQFLPWNALRRKDCARWVVATFNPFLLRSPYASADTRELRFAEPIAGSAELLWGHPGWLLLERLAAGYAQTGWPGGFEGTQAGCVGGLELREHPAGMAIPVRYPLGPQAALDLAEHGVTALACEPNRDRAYLLQVPMLFAQPPLSDRDQDSRGRRMMRLDYQLAAAALASAVAHYLSTLPAEADARDNDAALEAYLRAHIASSGPDAEAEVSVAADRSGRPIVEITARLGRGALGGVPIRLTLSA